MRASVNEIWELIDSLSIEEKKIIYKRMQNEINEKLLNILDRVSERAEKEPISIDEITSEVEEARGQKHGQN